MKEDYELVIIRNIGRKSNWYGERKLIEGKVLRQDRETGWFRFDKPEDQKEWTSRWGTVQFYVYPKKLKKVKS